MKTSQNEIQVEHLKQPGDTQAKALERLRELLVTRLKWAFRSSSVVDAAFLDDVVQNALLRILDSLDQFQGRSKFTTWATSIAVRTAYTELRRRHWKDVSLDSIIESRGDTFAATGEDAGDGERQQLIDAMYVAIETKLTEKQRVALLAELAGMPMEEIGRRTGSSRNAIYKLTHDARKRLGKVLAAEGFSADDYRAIHG